MKAAFLWGILIAIVLIGMGLWWPPTAVPERVMLWWPLQGSSGDSSPDRYSDLGAALVGGAVVAVAVLIVQRRNEKESERSNLQLVVGLQRDLQGMDFSERDLSGFYLRFKDFTGANFQGANLQEARCENANFNKADLREAKLGGANLTDATLDAETMLDRASYNPSTVWPDDFVRKLGILDPYKTGILRKPIKNTN